MKYAIIAAIAAIAPPVFAACPPEQLQKAVDLNVLANKLANKLAANGDSSAIVAGLEANRQACVLDPFVMLVDARSWIALATKTSDKAALATFADRALSSLLASERQTNVSVGGQRPATADGKPIQIVIGVNRELAQGVVQAALATERIIGRTLPSNPPPGPGVAVQTCDSNAVSYASAALDYVKEKGDSAGALNMIARASAGCGPRDWQGDYIRVYGAQTLQAMAERNPAAPGLLEPMLKAAREIDGVGQAGRTGPLDWDGPARGRFARALFAVASANKWTMPVEQWFTPDNLNKTWTNAAMAVALDRAWAEGHATGGDLRARTEPYKTLFVSAYTSAANGPETMRKLAKDSLYWAARRHAEGTYRGKGNESLNPPPDFLWKSLHDPANQ